MGRLHTVVLQSALIFSANSAFAADYCSLVVRVLSPDGKHEEAIVAVEEKNGRRIERDPTAEDVRFCDLGVEPVAVKVGSDGTCNQVVVREVPLAWREQYLLMVTYDTRPCLE
jgi:hypothetical protein